MLFECPAFFVPILMREAEQKKAKGKKHARAQIVSLLRQIEVVVANGRTTPIAKSLGHGEVETATRFPLLASLSGGRDDDPQAAPLCLHLARPLPLSRQGSAGSIETRLCRDAEARHREHSRYVAIALRLRMKGMAASSTPGEFLAALDEDRAFNSFSALKPYMWRSRPIERSRI